MTASSAIVLTTDFGLSDPYVGIMKGVILGINPQANILDLTHQIQPQNLRQAAFVLSTSHRFFPDGTIHVVVVDPGVGTDRKAVLLTTPTASFVAPDNGVLDGILADYLETIPEKPGPVLMPESCCAYQLTNPDYWLHPVSNTFHGRDIFAPVAAHLSLGVAPAVLGSPLKELVWRPGAEAIKDGHRIIGEVIYADHFGNLITNVPNSMLTGISDVEVVVKGCGIHQLSRTFQDDAGIAPGQPMTIPGSNGYLEIAVRDGNAGDLLGVGAGESVEITVSSSV